jgi:hypothetical protein
MVSRAPQPRRKIDIYSKKELSVMAGGGIHGFGGVAIFKPQENLPTKIGLEETDDPSLTFGFIIAYDHVSRLYVNGARAWINRTLPDAPPRRQDILGTGRLQIEFFDSTAIRDFIQDYREQIAKLGLQL